MTPYQEYTKYVRAVADELLALIHEEGYVFSLENAADEARCTKFITEFANHLLRTQGDLTKDFATRIASDLLAALKARAVS